MTNFRHSVTPVVITGLLAWGAFAPSFSISPTAYEHYQKGVQLEQANDFRGAEQAYRMAIGLDPYDSMTYLKLAYIVERDGRRDEALNYYQQALQRNPSDVMIHLSIAQLLESKNQLEEAASHYKQLVASNPQYTYAYLPLARIQKSLKQHPEAIASYQHFLKNYSRHVDAQREVAALFLAEKQYDQAANTYQNLKSQDNSKFKDDLAYGIALNNADRSEEALAVFKTIQTPSALLYQQMGISAEKLNLLQEAITYYQQAINIAPQSNVDLYLKIADLTVTLNQPHQATQALQAYLQVHPDNGKVAKSLADLLLQNRDFSGALIVYQQAVEHLPESEKTFKSDALRSMGYAYQMQGKLQESIDTYEASLHLEDNGQARLNLALAHHRQGNYHKALELYRKLLIENPDSETLKKDMGQVLVALGEQAFKQKNYTQASTYYQDALLLGNAQEVAALLGLANTQYMLKNHGLAYSTYDRILEKDPDNVAARMNKAQIDLEQKNYLPALENLRWVTQNRPDYFDAYKLLAQTHEGLGDYGQALLNYQKALEIHPNDTTLLMGYGNAWRHVGDLDRAQKAYELAKSETPDNAYIRYNLAGVYNLKNNLDASLKEYQAAIELNPKFIEPYYGMGTTLEKQKKWKEALSVYEQFVEKAPPSSSYVPLAKERIEVLRKSLSLQTSSSDKP